MDIEKKPVFGLHTAEFKKWITGKEARAIYGFFGVGPHGGLSGGTRFYDSGVTKLWIEKIPGKGKPRYYMHIIVNFTRALGGSGYAAMPYTTANVRRAFGAVNGVLKKLPLSGENCRISEWTPERVDSTFDVYEEQTELLMLLLNRFADLGGAGKRCRRMPIPDRTPGEAAVQSMRFGNSSFTYNIYRKLEEIRDRGKPVTEEEREEIRYLLRVERQTRPDGLGKLLTVRRAGSLTKACVRDAFLKVMIDEAGLFFGRGDFRSWKRIKEEYLPDRAADISAIKPVMKAVTDSPPGAGPETVPKEARKIFDRLGISPAGIRKDEEERYGTGIVKGIHSRITAAYQRPPDRGRRHPFPVPHRTGDGRYKSAIILYDVCRGKKQVQVAGRTLADYERKVMRELERACRSNRLFWHLDEDMDRMLKKSVDSVRRFREVAETRDVREEAERLVEALTKDCPDSPDDRDRTADG